MRVWAAAVLALPLYACANSWVYGGTVQRSTDLGKTWARSEGLGLPEESGLKLASTWRLPQCLPPAVVGPATPAARVAP